MNKIAIILTLLLTLGVKYATTQSVETPVNTIRAIPDIQYGEDERQTLDIFIPPGEGNFPVLFFVHGGAWTKGHREMYGSIGYFYAKRGYLTVLVDHRPSPKVIHPAHIEDVAKAFAWTHNNIATYGGDPKRTILFGHSSGAHLVSLLVTNQKYLAKEKTDRSNVKGVIIASGVYRLGTNISIAGYGHVFPSTSSRKDASPIYFIDKNLPPFCIMYAERDVVTLGSQAYRFHNALQELKVRSSLHVVKREDHITIVFDTVNPEGISKVILDFLNSIK